jgi:hypothetical protein
MRIFTFNFALAAIVVVVYLWVIPSFFDGIGTYLPMVFGGCVAWVGSGWLLLHKKNERTFRFLLFCIALGLICALVAMAVAIALVIRVRGS